MGADASINRENAERVFAESVDGTVGIEEEFQLLDPDTLELAARFEQLDAASKSIPGLSESIAGELISTEIEIRSGRGKNTADALRLQSEYRGQLRSLVSEHGLLLGSTGTHPFADYKQQQFIDTPHYRRRADGLKWVALRNTTFSLHVHVGVNGGERAMAVTDRLRPVLPLLLAISANSPFLDGLDTGLHSVRSQTFTKNFPRCGIPDHFGSWDSYWTYLNQLQKTNSIVEYTQVWWSVRPHLAFGTVEVRICDAQSSAAESDALTQLIVACVMQAARDHDEGKPYVELPTRLIEENFWRAIRFGLNENLIDWQTDSEFAASETVERLLQWTAPVRSELGLDPQLPSLNGAQRQQRAIIDGATVKEAFAQEVARTTASYR